MAKRKASTKAAATAKASKAKNSIRGNGAVITALVDGLFARPPEDRADLRRRLAGHDAAAVREALVARLAANRCDEDDVELVVACFDAVGIGGAEERLEAIATDGTRTFAVRAAALGSLGEPSDAARERIADAMAPGDMTGFLLLPFRNLLLRIQEDPEAATALWEMIREAPDSLRPSLVPAIEGERQRLGTTAALTWGPALRQKPPADLEAVMVQAVIDEGGSEAEAILEALRGGARDGESRRRYQTALLRLRTRAANLPAGPSASALARGRALVGSCDGQGAFILFGVFDNPDGSTLLANLCIRAAADIRDGFVNARVPPGGVEDLLERSREGGFCDFAEVTLEEAAGLIGEALTRTRAGGRALPADAVPALSRFALVSPRPLAVVAAAAEVPDLEAVMELISPRIFRAWFFDAGDLEGMGEVPRPQPGREGGRAVLAVLARRLDSRARRDRVVGMARHMARYHSWRGEKEEAAAMQALAEATARDFASSPLVHAVLVRSLAPTVAEEEDLSFGDADVRRRLRRVHFSEVERARGRELSRLDFTEAALVMLEDVCNVLPGEERPRQEQLERAAFVLGAAFADSAMAAATSGGSLDRDRLASKMIRALAAEVRLERKRVAAMVGDVMHGLIDFMAQACQHCPVACFDHPGKDLSEAFFSDTHPSSG